MIHTLTTAHDRVFARVESLAASWLPQTLGRFAFAAVLLVYYWNSAALKLGDGLFGILSPSVGAYAQIFPRTMEAVSYNIDALGISAGSKR